MNRPIRLGVSRCLLGDKVRYDGGHKHDPFLDREPGRICGCVPVCPEVECGLPIPREAMRLVGNPGAPPADPENRPSTTPRRMQEWATTRLAELDSEGLCGFIFKSKSPSSGMERVKVYSDSGQSSASPWASSPACSCTVSPCLPVEEEGRLHDIHLRENFIDRIFVLRRYRDMLKAGQTSATWSLSTPGTSSSSWPTALNSTGPWATWWPRGRQFPRSSSSKTTTSIS